MSIEITCLKYYPTRKLCKRYNYEIFATSEIKIFINDVVVGYYIINKYIDSIGITTVNTWPKKFACYGFEEQRWLEPYPKELIKSIKKLKL